MTRALIGVAAAVPLLLASLGAAPADSLSSLGGHWRCAVAGGRPAERSYFPVTAKLGPRAGRREVFAREDTTEPDGAPSTSFEHMVETASNVEVESVEGHGTGANATPLRFAGRDYEDKATMELTYAVSGDTMRRTAKRGAATVDDESCTREPEATPVASCAQPNVPARVVRPIEPYTPPDAYAAKAKGLVQVRIVLDDRSRVLWADIITSASPLFNDAAVQAARGSTFQTAIVNCRPIASEYVFSVDFE